MSFDLTGLSLAQTTAPAGDFPLSESEVQRKAVLYPSVSGMTPAQIEDEIRSGLDNVRRTVLTQRIYQDEQSMLSELYNQSIRVGDATTAIGANEMANRPMDGYEIERNAVDAMVFTADTPIKDAMLGNQKYTDYLKNMLILQQFTEEKKKSLEDQGVLDSIVDAAGNFITNFQFVKQYRGNLNLAEGWVNDVFTLLQSSPENFPLALEAFWGDIKDRSGWLGVDEQESLKRLSRIAQWNSDSFFSGDNLNYLDLIDVGALAGAAGKKLFKKAAPTGGESAVPGQKWKESGREGTFTEESGQVNMGFPERDEKWMQMDSGLPEGPPPTTALDEYFLKRQGELNFDPQTSMGFYDNPNVRPPARPLHDTIPEQGGLDLFQGRLDDELARYNSTQADLFDNATQLSLRQGDGRFMSGGSGKAPKRPDTQYGIPVEDVDYFLRNAPDVPGDRQGSLGFPDQFPLRLPPNSGKDTRLAPPVGTQSEFAFTGGGDRQGPPKLFMNFNPLESDVSLLAATGKRSEAAATALNRADAHTILPKVEQTLDRPNLSLSGVSSAIGRIYTNISDEIRSSMDRLTPFKTQAETDRALQLTRDHLATDRRYTGRVVDVLWDNPDRDRSEFVRVMIGDSSAKGFTSSADANAYIRNNPGLHSPKVTQSSAGDWYVESKVRPNEVGAIEAYDTDYLRSNPFVGWISGKRQSIPEPFVAANLTSDNILQNYRHQMEDLNKFLRISDKEMNRLDAVLRKGSAEYNPITGKASGKWYDLEEYKSVYRSLHREDPSQKAIDAYYASVAKSDLAYEFLNYTTRRELGFLGFKLYENGAIKAIGKDVTAQFPIGSDARKRVYAHLDQRSKKAGDWKAEDVRIIELKNSMRLGGQDFRYVVADGNTVLNELPNYVTPYNPGGSRVYSGRWFLKQAMIKNANGLRIVDNPRVFTVFESRKEAQEMATNLNDAAAMHGKWQSGAISQAVMDKFMSDRFKGKLTTADFDNAIKSGEFDPSVRIHALIDNNVPPEQAAVTGDDVINHTTSGSTTTIDMLAQKGSLLYSNRGNHLTTIDGAPVSIQSPTVSIHNSLDQALRGGAYYTQRLQAIYSWNRTAAELGEDLSRFRGDIVRAVLEHTPNTQTTAGVKLANIQKHIKNEFWSETANSGLWRNTIERFIDDKDLVGTKRGTILDLLSSKKLPVWLRTLAFTRSFFGDYSQLLVQGISATQSWSLSPKHALGAIRSNNFYQSAMLMDKFGALDAGKTATLAKMAGVNTKEFIENMKFMKDSGALNISGQIGMLDNMDYNSFWKNRVSRGTDTGINWGLFFFKAPEKYLRLNGMNLAIREFRAANPGASIFTPQATQKIMSRMDNLTLNMSRSNNAEWQKGWASVFTQFMGFTARNLDAMFGVNYSKSEKAAIFLNNFLMFGAAGVPMGMAGAKVAEYFGVDEQSYLDMTQGLFVKGLEAIFDATVGGPHVDISAAQRFGPYDQVNKFAQNILDAWATGKLDADKFLSPPPGVDSLFAVGKPIFDVIRFIKGEDQDIGPTNYWEAMQIIGYDGLKGIFSALRRTDKALYISQFERWRSNSGELISPTVNTTVEAIIAAFGMTREDIAQVQSDIGKLVVDSQYIDNMAKQYSDFGMQIIAINQDRRGDTPEGKERLRQLYASRRIILDAQEARVKIQILNKANSMTKRRIVGDQVGRTNQRLQTRGLNGE